MALGARFCTFCLLVTVLLGACFPQLIQAGPRSDSWIEVLSWSPRAFLYHGFLSDEECQHIIDKATPRMKRSSVINYDGTINDTDSIRTSYGCWIQ